VNFPLIQSIEIGAAKKQQHSVMTSDWLRPDDLAFRCCKLVHLARPVVPICTMVKAWYMVYDVYGHPICGSLITRISIPMKMG
jgi:hypothetical protein